jgi:pimeloyl-ACP methyl ester carboxylesterase
LPKAKDESVVYLEERGAGPAVVLFHGTPSSVDDFGPLAAVLARCHRVLVPHMHGYGRTASGRRPYSLEKAIAEIETRLLDDGVRQAAFVAFSGGAYKAAAIALRGRIAVSRMVLFAPVLGLDAEVAQGQKAMVEAVRNGTYDPRGSWLQRMAGPGFEARDPAGAARVRGWLDAVSTSLICEELVAIADAPDLRPRLVELQGRVLICTGDADQAVPPAASEALARTAAHGEFRSVAGAGHALLIERPDEVIQMVHGFLADSQRAEG